MTSNLYVEGTYLATEITEGTYNADGQASQVVARKYPDGSRATSTYDLARYRTKMQDSTGRYTLVYEALNRTSAAHNPQNKTMSYTYDAVGNRRSMQTAMGFAEWADPASTSVPEKTPKEVWNDRVAQFPRRFKKWRDWNPEEGKKCSENATETFTDTPANTLQDGGLMKFYQCVAFGHRHDIRKSTWLGGF